MTFLSSSLSLVLTATQLSFLLTKADPLINGLVDPDVQPLFEVECVNALAPEFSFDVNMNYLEVGVREGVAETGLVDSNGNSLITPIWGYGQDDELGYTWPGRTIHATSYKPLQVRWLNELEPGYLITGLNGESIVDTSIHWAYSLPGYEQYSIEKDGCPLVMHLHGANTESPSDGNPEFFFSPNFAIKGPQWENEVYDYHNSQGAAALWFHDHTLGITAPNVYAGLAGFYIIRDEVDTGKVDNPLSLPAYPYEAAFVVQDRMFKDNGELFYPAFEGDPAYEDFIVGENSTFPSDRPTKLAEFFGDIMTVNGKIWPKFNVEPRKYRIRLLNGCDSRYLILQFFAVAVGDTDTTNGSPLPFTLIGGDDGLADSATELTTLLFEPSARYDVIFDFADLVGKRIIMANLGGDEPFGGEPTAQVFNYTDRVMSFDVTLPLDETVANNFDPSVIAGKEKLGAPDRVRKMALFEGRDEFNRLQPLLGTAEPATDMKGMPIFWPNTAPYQEAGLAGKQMEGSMAWHSPVTENPKLNDVEEWEIWNLSADAHPIHVHLVSFEVISRTTIKPDSNADEEFLLEEEEDEDGGAAGDGTYLEPQTLVQHDGSLGEGFRVVNPTEGGPVENNGLFAYQENFPRDVVAALPGQVTRIRMKFDRPGRFVWHCHVLSHEDHEMMRVLHVGEMPYQDHGEDIVIPAPDDDATAEGDDAIDEGDDAIEEGDDAIDEGEDDDNEEETEDDDDDGLTFEDDDESPAFGYSLTFRDDDSYEASGRRTFFFFDDDDYDDDNDHYYDDDDYYYNDDDDDDDDVSASNSRTFFIFDRYSRSSGSADSRRRNLRKTKK